MRPIPCHRGRPRPGPGHWAGLPTWLVLTCALFCPLVRGNDAPLALTDLADYRRALTAREKEPRPPVVSFRQLWDHPAKYQGTRIEVEGRIVRRFRQGAIGTFPPLVEAWAVTPQGEPFCLVYPAAEKEAQAARTPVRFVGTYLKRIRYQGADVDRLAPLIVGPRPPFPPPRTAPRRTVRPGYSAGDWIVGTAAAMVVVAVLAWQHLRKPVSRTSMSERFVQGENQDGSNAVN